MAKTYDITIRSAPAADRTYLGESLAAGIDEQICGSSPDEALGYIIRDLWLRGALDSPVKLNIEIESD